MNEKGTKGSSIIIYLFICIGVFQSIFHDPILYLSNTSAEKVLSDVLKEQLKFYGNFYPYLATEKREKQLRIIKKHWPFRES